MTDYGIAFQRERERREWSRAELSESLRAKGLLHVIPSTVAKMESGERSIQSVELIALADVFGVSIDGLVGRPRGGELAMAVANLSSNAQKMANDIGVLQTRLRGEYDDVREAVTVGGEAVTSLLEIGGSAILALSNARDWLNRLANQWPIPS